MNSINQLIIEIRKETGLSRKAFSDHFGIPLRTVEDWEAKPNWKLKLNDGENIYGR